MHIVGIKQSGLNKSIMKLGEVASFIDMNMRKQINKEAIAYIP